MKKLSILSVLLPVALLLLPGCAALKKVTPSGPFDSPAYRAKNPANVRVKVSLQNRMVYVMEGDRPLLVTPTAIGKPGKETPKGHFRVTRKEANKRSYTYGFWVRGEEYVPGKSSQRPPGGNWRYVGFPMPYWVEWMPAYGFHTGSVWPTPRTMGCLRLHKNVAPKFFDLVRVGTPVHIAETQPEDQTLGRNVRRPSDYADPDPHPAILTSSRAFTAPAGRLYED